ncbi:hypothetical protein RB597_004059 [Gaeumannomyces tritici]
MAGDSNRDRDQSLLDRLNALKGTNLNLDLDTSQNALGIPISSFAPAPKEARDDALSARLRSLRETSQDAPPSAGSSAASLSAVTAAAGVSTPPAPAADLGKGPVPRVAQPPSKASAPHRTGATAPTERHAPTPPPPRAGGPISTFSLPDVEDHPLFASDGRDLDDLLEGLEDLGLAEEDEEVEGAGGGQTTATKEKQGGAPVPSLDEQLTEAQRTAALFAKFEKQASKRLEKAELGEAAGLGEEGEDKNDDDSDGEEMRREADEALLRALDELSLEGTRPPAPEAGTGPEHPGGAEDGGRSAAAAGAGGDEDGEFSLPTPPSTLPPPVSGEEGGGAGKGRRRGSADFEADFSSRLARLKAGRDAGAPAAAAAAADDDDDELGLPSVPSYKPGDVGKTTRLTTKTGYTDDDVESWCILCLEDATCRCEGCDDDVYCEQCWWGMHVGPSADYDARGHRRWKFTKN